MCLVIALVLFVKAVWEWLFPDERFMILFFFGLNREYSYNYSRFRIYDIVLTLFSSNWHVCRFIGYGGFYLLY